MDSRRSTPGQANAATARQLMGAAMTATEALEALAAMPVDLPLYRDEQMRRRATAVDTMLRAAARDLMSAISRLVADDQFWRDAGISKWRADDELFDPGTDYRVHELMTDHLPVVLTALGYTPPPPSDDWTKWVKGSLQSLQQRGPGAGKDDVAAARGNLLLFNLRLRRLIEVRDEPSEPEPSSRLQRAIAAALRVGRHQAVAGAVAAGAAGLIVAGTGGAATGAALGAVFADEATKELFKTWIQALFVAEEAGQGSSGWIGEPTDALALLMGGLSIVEHSKVESDRKQGAFLARRGIFALLELVDGNHPTDIDVFWEAARHLADVLAHEPPDLGLARKLAELLDGLVKTT